MISYAQNFEDVVLQRFFAGQQFGFYIDVGAWDPTRDSVTRHFYDKGWCGINIEPDTACFEALKSERQRDVSLQVALGRRPGTRTMYILENSGTSTLSASIAKGWQGRGLSAITKKVPVMTLASVCREYVRAPIDFLKVDVEGLEGEVIEGGEWSDYSPRIIVMESIHPVTQAPMWMSWEPKLLARGYRFIHFDGLNRFYGHVSEDAAALSVITLPPNVLDQFTPYELVRCRSELMEFHRRAKEAETEVAHLFALTQSQKFPPKTDGVSKRAIEKLQDQLDVAWCEVAALRELSISLRAQISVAQKEATSARQEGRDALTKLRQLGAELEAKVTVSDDVVAALNEQLATTRNGAAAAKSEYERRLQQSQNLISELERQIETAREEASTATSLIASLEAQRIAELEDSAAVANTFLTRLQDEKLEQETNRKIIDGLLRSNGDLADEIVSLRAKLEFGDAIASEAADALNQSEMRLTAAKLELERSSARAAALESELLVREETILRADTSLAGNIEQMYQINKKLRDRREKDEYNLNCSDDSGSYFDIQDLLVLSADGCRMASERRLSAEENREHSRQRQLTDPSDRGGGLAEENQDLLRKLERGRRDNAVAVAAVRRLEREVALALETIGSFLEIKEVAKSLKSQSELQLRGNVDVLLDVNFYSRQAGRMASDLPSCWQHYLSDGWKKGYDPHPLFSTTWYLQQNPDVAVTGINPLIHFLAYGAAQKRSPHSVFDTDWYLTQYADVREMGINPLTHFLTVGFREGRWPNALFDAVWYCRTYGDVADDTSAALLHYVLVGAEYDFDPCPLFSSKWYRAANPDLGATPLGHYLRVGAAQHLTPCPYFDPDWYLGEYQDVAPSLDAFSHYVRWGRFENRNPSAYFDRLWYFHTYPDVQEAGMDPVEHYVLHGWRELRDPSPAFSTLWYLETYRDVAESGICPLIYYLTVGRAEGHRPRASYIIKP